MFDLFRRRTAKDFMEEAKENYIVPKVKPIEIPKTVKKEQKEYYCVGRTDDGMTTLTMIADDGYTSMTLTMNQSACEQMIRMLRATYDEEVKETDGQST
jgi:hypothetical protein